MKTYTDSALFIKDAAEQKWQPVSLPHANDAIVFVSTEADVCGLYSERLGVGIMSENLSDRRKLRTSKFIDRENIEAIFWDNKQLQVTADDRRLDVEYAQKLAKHGVAFEKVGNDKAQLVFRGTFGELAALDIFPMRL